MPTNEQLIIYILEDDNWYSKFLEHQLSLNPDHTVKIFNDSKTFLNALKSDQPDVITLDYYLPDTNGSALLKEIKKLCNKCRVIIISGQEDVETAINLIKEGAYDYIVKNDDTKNRILNIVQHIKENVSLEQELDFLRAEVKDKYDFEKNIIGNSSSIKEIFSLMSKAANTKINVSISGETGTGKELVAKSIHFNSDRNKNPFVAVNVSAIPQDLIESELFGHEKGAFTGAHTNRIGKFEEANGGTIFLDEIAEFNLNLQSKLLRVLQEREITRIGSNQVIPVDVRVITATHKNLSDEVRKGNFREDLYYRLIGLPIVLPPLRDRDNDVLVIAKHLISTFCKENKIKLKSFSKEAKEKLIRHNYPGNVRELKAVIELAIVMSEDDIINPEDIRFNNVTNTDDILKTEMTLDDYTNKIIQFYLDKYHYNVIQVAKKLEIGKSTIYRLIQEGKIRTTK